TPPTSVTFVPPATTLNTPKPTLRAPLRKPIRPETPGRSSAQPSKHPGRPPTRASDATNILPYCDIFAGNLRYCCGNFIHDRSSCPITCRRQSGVLKHCRHSDDRPEIAVRSQSFHDQVAA